MLRRGIRIAFGLLLVAVAGAAGVLALRPPELLLVGTGYSAKIVCSNHFIAGRDAGEVLAVDVQAPGHPLLKFISAVVDEQQKSVTAHIFGFFAGSRSVYREGLGCTNLSAGHDASALAALPTGPKALPKPGAMAWPEGEGGPADGSNAALQALLTDSRLTGPGMRAVLVVKDGRIAGEVYGPGFSAATPLLGWSMTKTVNAAIAGTLIKAGRLSLDDRALLPEWAGDSRRDISLRDLTGMESGLAFNEDYGDVSDVTRMLYLQADMAGFAAGQPLESPPGTRFRYSTGTSLILSRIWMNRLGTLAEATAYPQKALFGPLSMSSAVLETDVTGTFVGGSYLYATARDWARFAQLLLQGGEWKGVQLLPEAFVRAASLPSRASGGVYSQAQTWLAGPYDDASNPSGLPEDAIWMQGHDGQSIAIIPSQQLIVLRMGLTPRKLGYKPQPLVKAVIEALDQQAK